LKLLKSFSVYAVSTFLNAALSFGTFSFLTHYLSERDYGIINLYNALCIFLVPFIAIGIQFTLSVDYFKMSVERFRTHFTNAWVIPAVSWVILTFLFAVFYYFIQRLIKVNFFFAVTIPLSCFLIVLNEVILNITRNKSKHFLFAGFTVSKNLIEIGLTFFFIMGLGLTWQGRLASALTTLCLAGIFTLFLIKKWKLFDGNFEKSEVKQIFNSGLPFIPERLSIFILYYSDRFFIDFFKDTADVGYYGAGAQIAIVVNLIILTLNNTFYPFFYKQLSQPVIDYKLVRKATLAFIGISAFVTVSVILAVPFIFKYFIGAHFQAGKVYAINLAIGMFLWSVYNVFVVYLLNLKKNKLIMIISIIGMVFSLSLNYFNVKHFGALGATYTSMIVYFLMAAMAIYFVHREYDLKKIFCSGKPVINN
jgi:O-antigen/teichoic acid export membrane protein